MTLKTFWADNNEVIKSDNKADKMIKILSKNLKNIKPKNLIYIDIKIIKKLTFLIFNIK